MIKAKIFIFLFAVSLVLSGCNAENQTNVNVKNPNSGRIETRNLADFKKIKAGDTVNLEIVVQKDFSITVETSENELKYVLTEVNGDTLIIKTTDKITSVNKAKVKISLPELIGLELSGTSEADVSGAKSESIELAANNFTRIKISGEVKKLKAVANGKSLIDAEKLNTENAEAKANGVGQVIVAPTNELNAEANGTSVIAYVGEPKKIKKNTNGEGSVMKK